MTGGGLRGYAGLMGRGAAWVVMLGLLWVTGCGGTFVEDAADADPSTDAPAPDAARVGGHLHREAGAEPEAAADDVATIDAGPEANALEAEADAVMWPGEDGGFAADASAADAMVWSGRDASPIDSATAPDSASEPDAQSTAEAAAPPTIDASVPQDVSPPCVPKNIAEACATGAGGMPALGGGYCGGFRPDGCGGEVDCSTNPCVTVNVGQTPETYYCGGGCAATCYDCCGAGCGAGCEAPTECILLP